MPDAKPEKSARTVRPPRPIEYWYLVRKLEQRLIGRFEGKVKDKKRLKQRLVEKQNGVCALRELPGCPQKLDGQIEVDRIKTDWNFDPNRNMGYFEENCRAVHAGCHRKLEENPDSWPAPDWLKERRLTLFKEVDRLLEELAKPRAP